MSKGITKFLHYFLGSSQVRSQGFETSVGTARLFSIYSGMSSHCGRGHMLRSTAYLHAHLVATLLPHQSAGPALGSSLISGVRRTGRDSFGDSAFPPTVPPNLRLSFNSTARSRLNFLHSGHRENQKSKRESRRM